MGVKRGVPRQGSIESFGEFVGVDGTGDGLADGAADGGEEADEGEHTGDVLVGRGGHDGHLLADDEGTTAEGDEDLAHYNVADALAGLAEVDHEADAEGLEAQHRHGEPLEAAEETDEDGQDYAPEAGPDAVDVADVAGVGN